MQHHEGEKEPYFITCSQIAVYTIMEWNVVIKMQTEDHIWCSFIWKYSTLHLKNQFLFISLTLRLSCWIHYWARIWFLSNRDECDREPKMPNKLLMRHSSFLLLKKSLQYCYLEDRMTKSAGKKLLLWTLTISPTATLSHLTHSQWPSRSTSILRWLISPSARCRFCMRCTQV
jgi:hypothetical protein